MNDAAEPHSDRLEAAALLKEVAHDLRTPLSAIATYAELMESERLGSLPAAYGEAAAAIGLGARQALALVEALLESGPRDAPEALTTIVQDALTLAAPHASQRDVGLSVAPDLPAIALPRLAVTRILQNLIDNALAATAPGGEVTLAGRRIGRELVVEVADTGGASGAPGPGLGLAIVRALCARLGGTFDLQPGAPGATARVSLPLATSGEEPGA